MNNDKIYKGHTDYKDLVQCEDTMALRRKFNTQWFHVVAGANCMLKADIVEVSQKGFTDWLRLSCLFDNKDDSFGQHFVTVYVPEEKAKDEYFIPKSNVYMEAHVELLDKDIIGYPAVKLIKWVTLDYNYLMFPHYICPECGTDYGTAFSLANNPEHQYCDLCEGENSRLIPISSRKEYKEKITNRKAAWNW